MIKNDINTIISSKIPPNALIINNVLRKNNYSCFFIGGAIRDIMLNYIFNESIQPKDWDIVTSARYTDIHAKFNKLLKVKNKHGLLQNKISRVELLIPKIETTAIIIEKNRYEVTPIHYTKNDIVFFENDINKDILERDFTINAMYYSLNDGIQHKILLDNNQYIDCIDDIKNRIIRTITNAEESFKKKPYHIIRGLRLSITLNFDIEVETLSSMKNNIDLIKTINKGKLNKDFEKIFLSNNFSKSHYLFESGVLSALNNNWTSEDSSIFIKILKETQSLDKNLIVRLTYIYQNITCKEKFLELLSCMGINKTIIEKVKNLPSK